MPGTRRLLREEITYSSAKDREVNILHRLSYPSQETQFFTLLNNGRSWIREIVAHHLNLSSDACHVADVDNWLHGSFNVCIPVTIVNWKGKLQPGERVLLRLPLPYRVGETFRPGNADEKVRCEAGTYAWLEDNCPDIPIPRLYGFAMSTSETFTHTENLPPFTRCIHFLRRRLLSMLGHAVPSQYVRNQRRTFAGQELDIGYLLIEYVEEAKGKMLSHTWIEKQDDMKLRSNLYHDLSRIFLRLANTPLPKIGSFVIDNNGFLRLTNRPLSLGIQELENEEIPTGMPRDYTYSTVDSYVVDTLSLHDNRLQHQPNAINDLADYIYQTSALTAMRAIFPLFFRRDLRRGPFIFMLTDLHQSNIFVDEAWHITSLVDMEWGCSLPVEMVQPPHWLTNKGVDQIVTEEYEKARVEFMTILTDEEERGDSASNTIKLSVIMNQAWEMGTFWYILALSSPTGLFALFGKKLQPKLIEKCPDHGAFHQIMPWYWTQDIVSIATRKLADRKDYDARLQQAFEEDTHTSQNFGNS
ncbi:uncharacterized protein BDCG_09390 [Blastomyces dermatitidis ER-3]|uniref:Aminoglycoside phosphotransferase domain-containing protein n=1 Tax=Ajellomyces dermatitidis (strain ER-3 / ATCC MYA-2586) TaxID=559297 RepID=A0ABP2ERI8_AJEDR|nr:uncharacterized protein BDCG_09390 [Blastomyces dermatitidis ER-3]EEQ86121.1 hypothetical protein BDCG_09390 [Blastomyces dermatitidis ER-3]